MWTLIEVIRFIRQKASYRNRTTMVMYWINVSLLVPFTVIFMTGFIQRYKEPSCPIGSTAVLLIAIVAYSVFIHIWLLAQLGWQWSLVCLRPFDATATSVLSGNSGLGLGGNGGGLHDFLELEEARPTAVTRLGPGLSINTHTQHAAASSSPSPHSPSSQPQTPVAQQPQQQQQQQQFLPPLQRAGHHHRGAHPYSTPVSSAFSSSVQDHYSRCNSPGGPGGAGTAANTGNHLAYFGAAMGGEGPQDNTEQLEAEANSVKRDRIILRRAFLGTAISLITTAIGITSLGDFGIGMPGEVLAVTAICSMDMALTIVILHWIQRKVFDDFGYLLSTWGQNGSTHSLHDPERPRPPTPRPSLEYVPSPNALSSVSIQNPHGQPSKNLSSS
ncbi:hypothetical protein DFQ27_005470 [Actinomortierella ambigua]|uniref:Transmembrane protein n=1 Tax=Actinomortierella ambigua TaxID=1343610 RepID=A0A9P6UCD5_9FUNG|nr:hypothetical protein DFQ27_005470 [Actinomortierella ambigua]